MLPAEWLKLAIRTEFCRIRRLELWWRHRVHKLDRSKSVMNKQKHTEHRFFRLSSACKVRALPHLHGDRGGPYRFWTSLTFSDLINSFAAMGCWNFRGNVHPQVKFPYLLHPLSKTDEIKNKTVVELAIQVLSSSRDGQPFRHGPKIGSCAIYLSFLGKTGSTSNTMSPGRGLLPYQVMS